MTEEDPNLSHLTDYGTRATIEQALSRGEARNVRETPAHYHDLDAVLATAWGCLAAGATNRRSGFHTANVASIRPDGWPSLRTVVLRRFKSDAREIAFHTDTRSRKFAEIAAHPQIAVHFYDAQKKIQMRLDCLARIDTANPASEAAWQASRPMSRACYAQGYAPGSRIENGGDATLEWLDEDAAFSNFAVVTARIEALDWLYLAAIGHRRALFRWDSSGTCEKSWLAP
jgi:pyridoxine/pyridoxamine 5'-phosphate oxidase